MTRRKHIKYVFLQWKGFKFVNLQNKSTERITVSLVLAMLCEQRDATAMTFNEVVSLYWTRLIGKGF